MRVFTAEKVNAAFERQAVGEVSAEHNLEQFSSYDDFERYQFEQRKSVWIDTLVAISGCKKRSDLESQWDLFGRIFRRFHANHMDWLAHPEICPPHISTAREEALSEIIESFTEQQKCHWKRDHQFFCFCD